MFAMNIPAIFWLFFLFNSCRPFEDADFDGSGQSWIFDQTLSPDDDFYTAQTMMKDENFIFEATLRANMKNLFQNTVTNAENLRDVPTTAMTSLESVTNTTEDLGIVTSLGLDEDAAVSPKPPVLVEEWLEFSGESQNSTLDSLNTTDAPLLESTTIEANQTTSIDVYSPVDSLPPEPMSSSVESTISSTQPIPVGDLITKLSSSTTMGSTFQPPSISTTTPTPTSSTSPTTSTTSTTTTSTSTTTTTSTKSTTTPTSSTTSFLSFIDRNFEGRYQPAAITARPLRCFVCSNANSNCDITNFVKMNNKVMEEDFQNLIPRSGVSLVTCSPDAKSCAKLSVTVRYRYDQRETRYETITSRFCSSVEMQDCHTKYGADSSYEQCYCKSEACNSSKSVMQTSILIIIAMLIATSILSCQFKFESFI